MPFSVAMPWHEGEEKMHKLMHVPELDNPTSSMLTPQAASMLQRGPLVAIGTLDERKRPWTTVWGGSSGLSQPLGNSIIGIKTAVDRKHDPVVDILFGGNADGEVVREKGAGRMIGGLTIDLESRKRVKLFGRMMAGAVAAVQEEDDEGNEEESDQAQVQLVVHIDQSLGNCPKYLNNKHISRARTEAALESDSADLTTGAVELVAKSDLFFVSSSDSDNDMDTNHRGGPPGFVRMAKSDSGQWNIYWPEYSGNRLYQTLGNLQSTPRAGLVFPDFETGDVLYVTGDTEVLIGAEAAKSIPHSNLAVRLAVTGARFVRKGLPFRGTTGERSPYNPKVRPLASEASVLEDQPSSDNTATLLEKTEITPTINRYRFSMSNPITSWKAGQWVTFDFSDELDIGYSHMRDDDPQSINDDFIRTFTVSSSPAPRSKLSDDEFEITIRRVGRVTNFLARQPGGGGLETPIRGFGGDTMIDQEQEGVTPFVAGGIGITPLLAQLPGLNLDRLRLFWTIHVDDIGLVLNTLERHENAGKTLSLFLTGITDGTIARVQEKIDRIKKAGAAVETRRLQKSDLEMPGLGHRWNVCVSTGFGHILQDWLQGKQVMYEDFNF